MNEQLGWTPEEREHKHIYMPIKHGSIIGRMCSCGKTDVLEMYEDLLDFRHERTYRWKTVEEPEIKEAAC